MKKYLSFAALVLVIVAGAGFASAQSSSSNDLNGWAWSSTIGWVSFNSADSGAGGAPYKVTIDSSGNFRGHAWSSNIGWISFEPADISGCHNASAAKVNLSQSSSRGTVSGWARALAGKGRTDGWDGCIELAGQNHVSDPTTVGPYPAYKGGVAMDPQSGSFGGFAWGGEVVGWLNFNADTNFPNVRCTNNCNPSSSNSLACSINSLPSASGGTLSWSSTLTGNAPTQVCTISANGTTLSNQTSGSLSIPPLGQTTTYSISCSSNATPPLACQYSRQVPVAPPPPPPNGIDLLIGRPNNINASSVAVKKGEPFGLAWNNGLPAGYSCTSSARLPNGDSDTQFWTSWRNVPSPQLNAASGTLSPINTTASMPSGPHRFTLTCNGPGGPVSDTVTLDLISVTEVER